MKRAPCINARQSTMQEAHTAPEGTRVSIPRSPPKSKEEKCSEGTKSD